MTPPADAVAAITAALGGLEGDLLAISAVALGVGVVVFAIGFGFRWAKGLIS